MATPSRPTQFSRPFGDILALLLLLGAAYLVAPFLGRWGALLIAAFCGVAGLLLVSRLVPELPLAILFVGMSLWGLLPAALFERLSGYWIPLTLGLGVICLGLHALWHGQQRLLLPKPVREDVWLVLFTGWVGFAITWSSSPSYGAFKFLGFAANVLCVYWLVRWAYQARLFSLRRLALLLVLAGLGHALVAFYISARIGIWGVGGATGDRLRTLYLRQMGLNKIAESTAIALGILSTLWLGARERHKRGLRKLWGVGLLGFQGWALFGYQQRGPMVGLILGTVVLVALLRKKILGTLRKGRLGTLLVVGLLMLVLLGALFYLLNPSFHASYMVQDRNVSSRLGHYVLGWDTFLSSPLRGIGTGGMGLETDTGYQRFYVHNLLMELLAETGVVGFGLFVALVGAVGARLWWSVTRLDLATVADMALPAAVFIYACSLAMFSGDLSGWRTGLWIALLVSLSKQGRASVVHEAAQVAEQAEEASGALI